MTGPVGTAAAAALLCCAGAALADDGDEEQELRERLTEREDETRVEHPWSTELFGHTLTFSGVYEIVLEPVHSLGIGDPDGDYDGFLLEQEIESELFYTLGAPLSVFLQLRLAMEKDLWSQVPDQVSDYYVERGETWINSQNIAGSGLTLEVGRLDFEDDRRFWWDDDLDAVRALYEVDDAELMVAVAREVAPRRSDEHHIDPEWRGVLRILGEASWDWSRDHSLQAFALHAVDYSPTESVDDLVATSREDDSDATLTWVGVRANGAVWSETWGILGYWLDAAYVTGRETLLSYEEVDGHHSVVEDRIRRDVEGWALDLGATWLMPLPLDPRLTLAWAHGSGESHPDTGDDRSFRQTGLQSNEIGYGGVQSSLRWGALLDPELSNLNVFTVGWGVSLFQLSSLDLVYHHYRLAAPTTGLRNARIDPELTGRQRRLGDEVDVVLAVEEWERLEVLLVGSFFRAGKAFGPDSGEWAYGAFTMFSLAF